MIDDAEPIVKRRIGKLRWWIIGLVTLGTILNYLARSTLSVAAPTLQAEFAMSTEEYSWVVLAFQASYTVMQTVAGGVLDALGTRLGFFLFAIGWALSNMAHAFATGWPSLAFFRGLLGATEAAAIPAGAKTVSEWFPPRERPLATSAFQMGTSVGNMIAPPLVAFCILWWGWQEAFLVTGALSLFWAANDYSAAVGRSRAAQFVREMPTHPEAIVYSRQDLHLAGDVGVLRCTDTDGGEGYRWRYDGLALVLQSNDQYVLVPEGWTKAEGVAIVLPRTDDVRLEFRRPGGAELAATC